MKEIKAFVHRGRVADIVHALEAAGYRQLSVFDVKGLLRALNERESQYSIALGEKVTSEVQLGLVCPDEDVDRAVQLIRTFGRTGQAIAGWVYISPVDLALPIEGGETKALPPRP
ncbi:MAG: transcriptional regulator [Lysobacterales bacterium 69-70]|nr:P-II family nitrogen regulator [Xanthomonadaceae bacterium]ODU33301.1 MAG: transcriptional regulator [Xanthomonadaceae bacterium SCN 69-320]ODV16577.1 MAG: transcriptional regulator [Xanthomonadaceae bacterium SCN 69-25]OJZ00844.1 MAG: transcriptional regulator [Xanthomonadales bacterium 69-70]